MIFWLARDSLFNISPEKLIRMFSKGKKSGKMKYRNLGNHGLKISEISVGTMYHGSYIPKEDSIKVLTEAINQGINFIDCADRYGIFDSDLEFDKRTRAEIILGEFLKDYDREDLVISSKVFYKMRESPHLST